MGKKFAIIVQPAAEPVDLVFKAPAGEAYFLQTTMGINSRMPVDAVEWDAEAGGFRLLIGSYAAAVGPSLIRVNGMTMITEADMGVLDGRSYSFPVDGVWHAQWRGQVAKTGFTCKGAADAWIELCNRKGEFRS